ncbi:MAG: YggU family protein [Verrucomicrobia bacterium]|nr:YggU family protein [Verrucomicrobiota bacterium]
MTLPPFLRLQGDAVMLAIKVQPRASRNEIGPVQGSELKIKVTAPPVDSAANEALLRFLAERLDCPRGAVHLVRGQTSRHKIVAVTGLTPAEIQLRLLDPSRT